MSPSAARAVAKEDEPEISSSPIKSASKAAEKKSLDESSEFEDDYSSGENSCGSSNESMSKEEDSEDEFMDGSSLLSDEEGSMVSEEEADLSDDGISNGEEELVEERPFESSGNESGEKVSMSNVLPPGTRRRSRQA